MLTNLILDKSLKMSIYNEDELVPPSWIDQVFFEKVLKQYENNNDIKITNIAISPASMKGDHYASIMFRCKVTYCRDKSGNVKEKSLILKTLPIEDGPKRDMLKESNLFETEINMYTEALPKIEKILADCGEPTKLAAEIIYHSLEPHKVIIFEDLCEQGYDALRNRYLEEDEIKMIYRKIAKLHGVSYMLGRTAEHECVTKYEEGIFCNSTIMAMDIMSRGIKNFIDLLRQHKEFEIYLEKINEMEPEINQNCKDLYNAYKLKKNPNDIFVLNHGDFHMKNLMFKFNAKKQIEDVIMVDYQISCFAPSNIDLTYSQYMLLSPELRLRRNEMMHYYFEEFLSVLKKIKFQGTLPRYSDFQISSLKYRHFSVYLLVTFFPFVRAILVQSPDQLKDVETAQFVENPEMAATVYQDPDFIDELRRLLPRLLIDVATMSIYNEDELVAPSWINQEFFATVLKKYENNEDININNLDISPASKKGDHYASIMFRCQLNYSIANCSESKQRSLVLKTLPDSGTKADFLQQSKVFETEISMYTETLPKIEKILAECGEPTKLAAEIIYHSLQPRKVIIFEDLCEIGYDTLRTRYLTEEELRMIYRKVAKLHAVTFMLGQSETDHTYVTKYDEGIFCNSAIMEMDLMSGGIFKFIEMLAQHDKLKVYLEKVKAMQPEMNESCKALYNAYKLNSNQKEIFVLNHGDFHMKNLMFKFNCEQQAEDLIMVDYQICCYAPVTIDLIYSQYMMMCPEYRLRRNEFMQYYFGEFIRVLKKINYEGELPKYSDFQIANLRYRHFALFLLSTFLPLNHVVQSATEDELKEMNISEYIENTDTIASTYDHPGYIKELHQLLPSLLIEDELVAPEWINKDFLEDVLQQYRNDKTLKIIDFNISPACVKGDHYASIMFRCKLNYAEDQCSENKQKTFIIKTLPMEEGMKREMLMTAKLFETEIEMYSKTLPKIEKILAECGERTKLSAEIIYHSLHPHKVIILEDLCESDYDTVRGRYLTEDEVKAVYGKLAKLHAVSHMLGHSEDHECVTKYQDGLFSSTTIMSNDIIANGMSKFIDVLSKNQEFEKYLEKLQIMQPNMINKCKELYGAYEMNKDLDDIFVLNHGDFHMKNLMFKFTDENKIEDLIMVDYQISCYAPSNIDLTYSQYMLLSPDLRLRRNEFMQYYFVEFLRILKKIDFKGKLPLYSDFQISALKYRHFSIFLLATFFPMVVAFMISSANDLKDIDGAKLMENPDMMGAIIYQNQDFIDEIRKFMPILLSEGYLD
ncbi:hypothetical protein FF38_13554 [Lucilia cuprina]|uniref:CHK kinase-like domain-containing protein n=1 Tax=Lucilia cuprina TaxID=7375 RepID=A0A0L0BXD8_LUCCU|nr:hypothetical protein FF38_13554 [Lucilia cuprina]